MLYQWPTLLRNDGSKITIVNPSVNPILLAKKLYFEQNLLKRHMRHVRNIPFFFVSWWNHLLFYAENVLYNLSLPSIKKEEALLLVVLAYYAKLKMVNGTNKLLNSYN